MLFKVIHGKDVFELNPSLLAIEEFKRLTDRQMTFVILSTDYKSPFRKLAAEERKYQAAISAGYKTETGVNRLDVNGRNVVTGKVGNIQAAVNKYNELQKNEDYDTLMSITKLIGQIRDFNNKEDKTVLELEKAVNLNVGKLDKLLETKKNLEELLDMSEDEKIDPTISDTADDDTISTDDLPLLAQLNENLFKK